MVLVDYSDSGSEFSSEPEAESDRKTKSVDTQSNGLVFPRKRKYTDCTDRQSKVTKTSPPPLPSSFYSLYATNVRTSTNDDPSLHGGRKRQVPHVEGNWPTHSYLEWYPSQTESANLGTLIARATVKPARDSPVTTTQPNPVVDNTLHSFLQSDLGVQLPLHISLSVPLVLRTEQRADFQDALETGVRETGLRAFRVHATDLSWEPNFEKTRWFLVLRLGKPQDDRLNKLLAITNRVVRDLGLPLLYEGRRDVEDHTSSFHISIAWQLEEPGSRQRDALSVVDGEDEAIRNLSILCDCLKVKIGNTVHDIPLPERRQSVQGLGGM